MTSLIGKHYIISGNYLIFVLTNAIVAVNPLVYLSASSSYQYINIIGKGDQFYQIDIYSFVV